jgi:hypothetical protein
VNWLEAVAIIIAVFFIAGLMVGFLIVMALPALAHRRGSDRWDRERGVSQPVDRRRTGDGHGPGRPGWQEPPRWPGTGPYGGNPDGDDDGEGRDTGDQGGPPDHPWWPGT